MTPRDDIRRDLKRRGYAESRTDDHARAHVWRAAARSAARSLGRPVETARAGALVVAQLRDWPADELEQQLDEAQMTSAMRAATIKLTAPTAVMSAQPLPVPIPDRRKERE